MKTLQELKKDFIEELKKRGVGLSSVVDRPFEEVLDQFINDIYDSQCTDENGHIECNCNDCWDSRHW